MQLPIIDHPIHPSIQYKAAGRVALSLIEDTAGALEVDIAKLETFRRACDPVGALHLELEGSQEALTISLYIDLPEDAEVKAAWDKLCCASGKLYANPSKVKPLHLMIVEEFTAYKASAIGREQLKAEASVHDEIFRSLAARQMQKALDAIESNLETVI